MLRFIYLPVFLTVVVGSHGNKARECITESDPLGKNYRGSKHVTESGIECQPWKSDEPHDHENTASRFMKNGGFDIEEMGNYCRNVGGQTYGPWCYTKDPKVRYQACKIDDCPAECIDFANDPLGKQYLGTRSVTASGIECQPWKSDEPHNHENTASRFMKNGGFDIEEMGNYCRNVGGQTYGPWCYTKDPKVRYQACAVPRC